ncbi:3-hydroxyacyl-[acyl-carrier-protein] dehydratase [Hypnocyclicus thermotrophus]|uniref:3-hydroxyacyl-[acyl-carrier-protein] dehydratase FabZ n=1 Tax=Hypnocyclicus thermotrophus TaxID=1627895 RepID=A0AA46I667_9FUSO|nr:3-hydroxyacyl-ACP dehydratase FabZ [Hypnocyclicus thermotrophus]TDT71879.1 3-hydroxyacyl-[acyl-carrier-protein] dehydratase [Hypnocyclicus thermotrophus]
MKLDVMEIMKRIPHRYPFLLVDRIEELEPNKRVVAYKNVTINEDFFNGHFPGHPIMPGVLIIEGMAQALGVCTMPEGEEKVPYFMAINNVKFRKPVRPGDKLIYDVVVDKLKGKILKATGKALVDGEIVAQAELMFSIMDK